MNNRAIHLGESSSIPVTWAIAVAISCIGAVLWAFSTFASSNDVEQLKSDVRRLDREDRYLAEDVAFLRGKFDPNYEAVKARRARQDQEQ